MTSSGAGHKRVYSGNTNVSPISRNAMRSGWVRKAASKRSKLSRKRLMMHRHNELRAGGVCRLNRLLGRSVRSDPRIVSADYHDCEIDMTVFAQFRKTVGECRVA